MSDKPLILSLLIGLIVILVGIGVSLLLRMNSLSETYKKELAAKLALQKDIDTLQQEKISLQKKTEQLQAEALTWEEENSSLKDAIVKLNSRMEELQLENEKVEKLKDKLEDDLKDQLIKEEVQER